MAATNTHIGVIIEKTRLFNEDQYIHLIIAVFGPQSFYVQIMKKNVHN